MGLRDMLGIKTSHLSAEETAELSRCEEIITEGLKKYQKVGLALERIRDRQLYRAAFESFEAYTLSKWGMTATHAARLIDASHVARNLQPTGLTPETERQARELSPLPPPVQIAAWTDAIELSQGEQPTTATLKKAVSKRRPPRTSKRRKPIRLKVPGATICITPNKAFTTPEEALRAAIDKLVLTRAA